MSERSICIQQQRRSGNGVRGGLIFTPRHSFCRHGECGRSSGSPRTFLAATVSAGGCLVHGSLSEQRSRATYYSAAATFAAAGGYLSALLAATLLVAAFSATAVCQTGRFAYSSNVVAATVCQAGQFAYSSNVVVAKAGQGWRHKAHLGGAAVKRRGSKTGEDGVCLSDVRRQ